MGAFSWVAALEQEARTIEGLLAIENARFDASAPEETHQPPEQSLTAFLHTKISARHPTKDELSEFAKIAGYARDGQSIGRVIHLTLVNMIKQNLIREHNGRYEAVPNSGFFSAASP